MLHIRNAVAADVPVLRQLIYDLALYEREPESARATEQDLLRDGFGERPYFSALLAEWEGAPVGLALYFFNYSTWQGRPGLYLEDLFVQPAHRRRGIGRALFRRLAQIALEKNCGRFVWQVLDWNEPSIRFYEALGAVARKEWLTMRVDGEALARLAGRD